MFHVLQFALRHLGVVGGCLLLPSCGLVNSAGNAAQGAGNLLMSPLRMLNGTLRADATVPGGAVNDEELLRRAADLQRRGIYPGGPGIKPTEAAAPVVAGLQP